MGRIGRKQLMLILKPLLGRETRKPGEKPFLGATGGSTGEVKKALTMNFALRIQFNINHTPMGQSTCTIGIILYTCSHIYLCRCCHHSCTVQHKPIQIHSLVQCSTWGCLHTAGIFDIPWRKKVAQNQSTMQP